MIDESLRTFIQGLLPDVPVMKAYISQGQPPKRIWYAKTGNDQARFLSGQKALTTYNFDIEVHSLDIHDALSTAETIRNGIDGGNLGGAACGVYVDDASDDYEYRGLSSDLNYEKCAMQVRIITNI